jgi:hypothetical protein
MAPTGVPTQEQHLPNSSWEVRRQGSGGRAGERRRRLISGLKSLLDRHRFLLRLATVLSCPLSLGSSLISHLYSHLLVISGFHAWGMCTGDSRDGHPVELVVCGSKCSDFVSPPNWAFCGNEFVAGQSG